MNRLQKKQIDQEIQKDIEKWIEVNTFVCRFGRVTPEVCKKLRERPTLREAMTKRKDVVRLSDGTLLTRPRCCEECTEWREKAKEVAEKRRLEGLLKEVAEAVNKRRRRNEMQYLR